jgi:hypothetical protein
MPPFRRPAFEEVASMHRRIAVLVLLLGILPAVSHALPRGPEPEFAALLRKVRG